MVKNFTDYPREKGQVQFFSFSFFFSQSCSHLRKHCRSVRFRHFISFHILLLSMENQQRNQQSDEKRSFGGKSSELESSRLWRRWRIIEVEWEIGNNWIWRWRSRARRVILVGWRVEITSWSTWWRWWIVVITTGGGGRWWRWRVVVVPPGARGRGWGRTIIRGRWRWRRRRLRWWRRWGGARVVTCRTHCTLNLVLWTCPSRPICNYQITLIFHRHNHHHDDQKSQLYSHFAPPLEERNCRCS